MANFLTRMLAAVAPAKAGGKAPVASGGKAGAASNGMLPPLAPIKAPKGGGLSLPGWRKTLTATGAQLQNPVFDVTNVDLVATYRNGASTGENARTFARFSPEVAASVAAHNRVGIPEKYLTIARDPDGSFNLQGTQLAMQILRQMNAMPDYDDGFSHVSNIRSVAESLSVMMQTEGAMCMELVLDKNRLPLSFQPIPVGQIVFYDEDTGQNKGLKIAQKIAGQYIDLDFPTIFYTAIDPSAYNAYPQSPMESALQPVLAATTFLQDLRRLCARHVYQRYDVVINEELLKKHMPLEVQQDPTKITEWLDSVIEEVRQAIDNLGLEEALIHYDFFEVTYIDGDKGTLPDTFNTVNDITGGKIATALKTPPSVLGKGSTTSGVASTETLLFMLNANGMVRLKLMEIFSKAMTLAVRLFGLDVTVEFEYDDIDLRPKGELEAYVAMKQTRLLTLLSLGMMTDEEVCLRLTGQLPPAGYSPLMGTYFQTTMGVAEGPPGTGGAPDNGQNVSQTGGMKSAPAATPGKGPGQKPAQKGPQK